MTSSEKKKRVRFSDTPPAVREFAEEPEDPADSEPAAKRRAVDPMEALEGEIMGVRLAESGGAGGDGGAGSGMGSMDAAEAAATRRAARRSHLLSGFEEEGPEGGFFGMEDIEGAEAGYEDPEEMFNDAGVPFEPFHLKREREEGYFDEAGSYVEYRQDDVEDAWADGLANVEVDEQWLARVMRGPGRQAADALAAGEGPDLSAEQIAAHKRRLVDLLLPGENVLQALRRLAAVRLPASAGGASAGGSPAASGGRVSPTAADPLARHPRALAGPAMPSAVREKFESLTGLSSQLMDQGLYSVHSMSREALERSILREELAEQQALGGQQPPGGLSPGSAAGRGTGASSGQPAAPAAAGAGSANGRSSSADAGQQLAERLLAGAAGGAGGRQNGSAAGAATGGGGEGGEEAGGAAAPPAPAVDADTDIFGGDQDAGDAPAAAPALGSGSTADQQTQQQQQQAQPESGDVTMQDSQQPPAAAQQAQQQQGQRPEPAVGGAAMPPAAAAAAATAAGGQPQELDGFSQDPSTGLWYSSTLGCYYDPSRSLFGDAASGLWYSFDAATGAYQLAAS